MKRIEIQVYLEHLEEIYHPYNKETLHPSLASFLEEECRGKDKNAKVTIQFLTHKKLKENEQVEVTHLIHKYFFEEAMEEQLKTKNMLFFYFITLMIGIVFVFLSMISKSHFFNEIFTIIAWLAIWEAIYSFTFHNLKENIRYKRMKQLAQSFVIFEEE